MSMDRDSSGRQGVHFAEDDDATTERTPRTESGSFRRLAVAVQTPAGMGGSLPPTPLAVTPGAALAWATEGAGSGLTPVHAGRGFSFGSVVTVDECMALQRRAIALRDEKKGEEALEAFNCLADRLWALCRAQQAHAENVKAAELELAAGGSDVLPPGTPAAARKAMQAAEKARAQAEAAAERAEEGARALRAELNARTRALEDRTLAAERRADAAVEERNKTIRELHAAQERALVAEQDASMARSSAQEAFERLEKSAEQVEAVEELERLREELKRVRGECSDAQGECVEFRDMVKELNKELKESKKKQQKAEIAAKDAENAAEEAGRAVEETRSSLRSLEAENSRLREERDSIRNRLERELSEALSAVEAATQVANRVEEAEAEARTARSAAEDAERRVTRAEAARGQAEGKVSQLEGEAQVAREECDRAKAQADAATAALAGLRRQTSHGSFGKEESGDTVEGDGDLVENDGAEEDPADTSRRVSELIAALARERDAAEAKLTDAHLERDKAVADASAMQSLCRALLVEIRARRHNSGDPSWDVRGDDEEVVREEEEGRKGELMLPAARRALDHFVEESRRSGVEESAASSLFSSVSTASQSARQSSARVTARSPLVQLVLTPRSGAKGTREVVVATPVQRCNGLGSSMSEFAARAAASGGTSRVSLGVDFSQSWAKSYVSSGSRGEDDEMKEKESSDDVHGDEAAAEAQVAAISVLLAPESNVTPAPPSTVSPKTAMSDAAAAVAAVALGSVRGTPREGKGADDEMRMSVQRAQDAGARLLASPLVATLQAAGIDVARLMAEAAAAGGPLPPSTSSTASSTSTTRTTPRRARSSPSRAFASLAAPTTSAPFVLTNALASREAETARLRSELASVRRVHAQLQAQLAAATEHATSVSKARDRAVEDAQRARDEARAARMDLSELQRSVSIAKTFDISSGGSFTVEHTTSSASRSMERSSEMGGGSDDEGEGVYVSRRFQWRLNAAEERADSLADRLALAEARADAAVASFRAASEHIRRMTSRHTSSTTSRTSTTSSTTSSSSSSSSATELVASSAEKEGRSELEVTSSAADALQEHLRVLEEELESQRARAVRAERKLAVAEKDVRAAADAVDTAAKRVASGEARLRGQEAEAESRLEAERARTRHVEDMLEETKNALQVLREQSSSSSMEARRELASALERAALAEERAIELERKIELRDEAADARKDGHERLVANLRERIETLSSAAEDAEAKVAGLESALEQAKAAMEELRVDSARAAKRFASEKSSLEKRISTLEASTRAREAEADALSDRLADAERHKEQFAGDLRETQRQLDVAQRRLGEADARQAAMEARFEQQRKEAKEEAEVEKSHAVEQALEEQKMEWGEKMDKVRLAARAAVEAACSDAQSAEEHAQRMTEAVETAKRQLDAAAEHVEHVEEEAQEAIQDAERRAAEALEAMREAEARASTTAAMARDAQSRAAEADDRAEDAARRTLTLLQWRKAAVTAAETAAAARAEANDARVALDSMQEKLEEAESRAAIASERLAVMRGRPHDAKPDSMSILVSAQSTTTSSTSSSTSSTSTSRATDEVITSLRTELAAAKARLSVVEAESEKAKNEAAAARARILALEEKMAEEAEVVEKESARVEELVMSVRKERKAFAAHMDRTEQHLASTSRTMSSIGASEAHERTQSTLATPFFTKTPATKPTTTTSTTTTHSSSTSSFHASPVVRVLRSLASQVSDAVSTPKLPQFSESATGTPALRRRHAALAFLDEEEEVEDVTEEKEAVEEEKKEAEVKEEDIKEEKEEVVEKEEETTQWRLRLVNMSPAAPETIASLRRLREGFHAAREMEERNKIMFANFGSHRKQVDEVKEEKEGEEKTDIKIKTTSIAEDISFAGSVSSIEEHVEEGDEMEGGEEVEESMSVVESRSAFSADESRSEVVEREEEEETVVEKEEEQESEEATHPLYTPKLAAAPGRPVRSGPRTRPPRAGGHRRRTFGRALEAERSATEIVAPIALSSTTRAQTTLSAKAHASSSSSTRRIPSTPDVREENVALRALLTLQSVRPEWVRGSSEAITRPGDGVSTASSHRSHAHETRATPPPVAAEDRDDGKVSDVIEDEGTSTKLTTGTMAMTQTTAIVPVDQVEPVVSDHQPSAHHRTSSSHQSSSTKETRTRVRKSRRSRRMEEVEEVSSSGTAATRTRSRKASTTHSSSHRRSRDIPRAVGSSSSSSTKHHTVSSTTKYTTTGTRKHASRRSRAVLGSLSHAQVSSRGVARKERRDAVVVEVVEGGEEWASLPKSSATPKVAAHRRHKDPSDWTPLHARQEPITPAIRAKKPDATISTPKPHGPHDSVWTPVPFAK